MRELDAQFGAYEHLQNQPRRDEALFILRKVASVVKPIMRKRGWRVGVLCEFLPPEANLMGLNVNRGQRICVRLRYNGRPDLFLPIEQVMDTMLHELCHIIWGPHDDNFQKLWDELRDEHETLLMKGFTGEGFLSKGHQVGGSRVPIQESQRKARAQQQLQAAQTKAKNPGRKLGSSTPKPPPQTIKKPARPSASGSSSRTSGSRGKPGHSLRDLVADATLKRNATVNKGCASGTAAAERMAEEARRNGFRTKAEEDDANNLAIAKALRELEQEEQARDLAANGFVETGAAAVGSSSLALRSDPSPPPPQQPGPLPGAAYPPLGFGEWQDFDEGLTWSPHGGLSMVPPNPHIPELPVTASRATSSTIFPPRRPVFAPLTSDRPISRLVAEDDARRAAPPPSFSTAYTQQQANTYTQRRASNRPQSQPKPLARSTVRPSSPPRPTRPLGNSTSTAAGGSGMWACQACTLHNAATNAVCEVCSTPRPIGRPGMSAGRVHVAGSSGRDARPQAARPVVGWQRSRA